jgi:hypothetical protein
VKLLDEILSDYPRVWEYYKHNTHERTNAPKYTQRYPLPLATLSMMIDFHKWTHATSKLFAETTGMDLPIHIKRTEVGPCPLVMFRLNWISNSWSVLQSKQKSLSETLGGEIGQWHTRIRVKVNDGDTYTYEAQMSCQSCNHRSVVRINDNLICVNSACRNPMTGEWLSWQVN